jgi:hypothetical protein
MVRLTPLAAVRQTITGGNGFVGDPEITTAGGLQPRILQRNKDGGHRAAFYPVACDLAVAGLMRMPRERTDSKTIPGELHRSSQSELQPPMKSNCKKFGQETSARGASLYQEKITSWPATRQWEGVRVSSQSSGSPTG